ncbi:MAG: prolyl oligopeptidase family serine peptidase [Fuerstiella sp.]|nr:prolyl oligopeptidase family serine peptidase [Fuerstiella sp.]
MHKTLLLLTAPIFLLVPLTGDDIAAAEPPSAELAKELQDGLLRLQAQVAELQKNPVLQSRDGRARFADVAVFPKAVAWMLRHNEFPNKDYVNQARKAIALGAQRASQLMDSKASWEAQIGTTIRGYFSKIDGSVQPYALTLPEGVNPRSGTRWPLHVKLHGRANDMNEVNFISRHEGRALPKDQAWVQLDVYGRGNNAYRWAGETDVFEAIADVRRRFRIDDNRVTLHGFSMGGAGAWHLGLHHPARWSSVGPGAGFIDFYKYQNQTELRPPWQHETLGIYDAIDYSLNAANVPICTYGGENDAQLVASTAVVAAAKALDVDIQLLIGPGMGHKFHPDSFREFMAFHTEKSQAGRRRNLGRQQIRFTTRSLRYNACDWLTIHETEQVYVPSTVEARINDDNNVEVSTVNVAMLSLARDVGTHAIIDGDTLPCYDAAEGLLPNVYFEKTADGWNVLDYQVSKLVPENHDLNKRHGLQGPIDDAFMDAFVCVTGAEKTPVKSHAGWVAWTMNRFRHEFDKWMRAEVRTVRDTEITSEIITQNNLILFGDPSSNAVLQKILPQLPVQWTEDGIFVGGQSFPADTHGLSMIYPNPLNPRRYVVINSGHTFHESDFKASNSWLFPRLGDIAIQRFSRNADGSYAEETVWAANFNAHWKLSGSE